MLSWEAFQAYLEQERAELTPNPNPNPNPNPSPSPSPSPNQTVSDCANGNCPPSGLRRFGARG